ncbi:twin-arginine translocase TatA/TatE family subunit [Psychroserpens ponticola]|uniref:Twin-arginine translocase TatA/TatE family subunit n=1 Tax=Psychroserpens ponticola TaxID=2932268 RepID=A0ABY7RXT4_9FLAO|nr:twin-arginine translocase TatA/TatE family subunit [Psychroserpens ponticola]WCO01051.1 twin-arginine translocase TatA/TatE family subunit [Psychroserpens ponticola]
MFILFIAVMVFGADKIPEVAKGLGKGMRSLKDASNDIKSEIKKSSTEGKNIETNVTQDIKNEITKVKDEIEDFSGSIKREQ